MENISHMSHVSAWGILNLTSAIKSLYSILKNSKGTRRLFLGVRLSNSNFQGLRPQDICISVREPIRIKIERRRELQSFIHCIDVRGGWRKRSMLARSYARQCERLILLPHLRRSQVEVQEAGIIIGCRWRVQGMKTIRS